MIYRSTINDDALQMLKRLVHTRIEAIYSTGLIVYSDYIEAQLYILNIGNRLWLNISNHAMETPADNDYYNFIIGSNDFPESLKYDKTNNRFTFPFGKIILSYVIESIEIYNRHEFYNKEELYYDVLILFVCQNHSKFMICLEERVDEFLVYSCDSNVIDRYINGLKLRATL